MRTVVRHRVRFGASHLVTDPEHTYGLCGARLHGHDWYAEILLAVVDTTNAPAFFGSLVEEIAEEHLNDLLPGVPPTPAGVAGWLVERTRMHVPGLISITVGHTDHAVTVEV